MRQTREQKRAQLLKAAEALIEEFLDWEEQAHKPNLRQIEDEVLRLRGQLGRQMAEVAVADQDAAQPVEAPLCPKCGVRMRFKGQKRHSVESRVGTLVLSRGYYHCSRCRERVFPPERTACTMG
jgi:uncharacterized protein with PIN domain